MANTALITSDFMPVDDGLTTDFQPTEDNLTTDFQPVKDKIKPVAVENIPVSKPTIFDNQGDAMLKVAQARQAGNMAVLDGIRKFTGSYIAPAITTPEPNKKTLTAYAPFAAVKAVHGVMSLVTPALSSLGIDTEGLLNTASEYWQKKLPETKIPDVKIGIGKNGLSFTPSQADLSEPIGGLAENLGWIAGPGQAGFKAAGLAMKAAVADPYAASGVTEMARPFFQSIYQGMIAGLLLGEGKKDKTLEDMALFGTLGGLGEVAGKLSDSIMEWWKTTPVKQRGLVLQTVDEAIGGMKAQGVSDVEIIKALQRWNPSSAEERAAYDEFLKKTVGYKTRTDEVQAAEKNKPVETAAEPLKSQPGATISPEPIQTPTPKAEITTAFEPVNEEPIKTLNLKAPDVPLEQWHKPENIIPGLNAWYDGPADYGTGKTFQQFTLADFPTSIMVPSLDEGMITQAIENKRQEYINSQPKEVVTNGEETQGGQEGQGRLQVEPTMQPGNSGSKVKDWLNV